MKEILLFQLSVILGLGIVVVLYFILRKFSKRAADYFIVGVIITVFLLCGYFLTQNDLSGMSIDGGFSE